MKNTMTRAHEIKKMAATKWNCSESEIVFGICLQMAHKENKTMDKTMDNIAKVIVESNGNRGELINKFDGTWDIFVNGKCGGSLHYTVDNVKNIMATKNHTVVYI